jgi:hypothetical protein
MRDYASERTLTYDPGASSMTDRPSPGVRAATCPPENRVTHSFQWGHHELRRSVAVLNHSSAVAGFDEFVQWPYFEPGALITPAMWPDADSTNSTGPP